MAAYAIPDDIAVRWRALSADEQALAAALIDDASDIIRVRFPDVDARLAAGSLSAGSVRRVVAQMVKRAMLNRSTEGVDSQQQSAGPFSVSNKFSNPSATLYLTAEEVRLFEVGAYLPVKMGWLA